MTKEDYAEVRDVFLEALEAIDSACEVFYDLHADFKLQGGPGDVAYSLEDAGAWIGLELLPLQEAQYALEKLVGKAHQRSR